MEPDLAEENAALRERIRELQVERDLLSGKLDVAQDALKELAGRCFNRLATIAEIGK